MRRIGLFLCLVLVFGGCALETTVPADEIWPDDKSMDRLQRDVAVFCADLVSDVRPGSVYLTWYDNLQPTAPMLADAYVVNMVKDELGRRGFTVCEDEKADYHLQLVMTPTRRSLLTMGTLSLDDHVIAAGEANFINSSEKWNKALRSKRYRTTTKIPLGGEA